MNNLTDEQIKEYFHCSYAAADGLWFMKVEEMFGFDTALKIDHEVWKVLPKIQSRMLKSMQNLDEGLDGLCEALKTRLDLENFKYDIKRNQDCIMVTVLRCPWHELLVKSGRENLSGKIGDLICREENSIWASEFGNFRLEMRDRICKGSDRCILCFNA
jgi:hypothetical protein